MTYRWTFNIIEFIFLDFEKKFKMSLKKMRRKEFTSLSACWTIDSLLCNLKRRTRITSSITFVRIVYYCALKYWSPLNVVATFFIKTISHWPPLYVSRSYSYVVLKLLPESITSWSNSPSPFVINNYFFPLQFPFPFRPTMTIAIVAKLQFWKLLNSLMESMCKTWKPILVQK